MADPRICSIDGCGKPARTAKLCKLHYTRKHSSYKGDMLAPSRKTASQYQTEEFIDFAIYYKGNDCLIWPYGKSGNGRSAIQRNNIRLCVTRIICESSKGPPPSPDMLAAHTCGKGHLSCVNPNHLYWATYKENNDDMDLHGTKTQGEKCHTAKLTEKDVLEILTLLRQGVTNSEIGRQYGVSNVAISCIKRGVTWKHVYDL